MSAPSSARVGQVLVLLAALLVPFHPAVAGAAPCGGGSASECETVPFYFHVGGRMDGSPGSREAVDPSTVYFSWDAGTVVYQSGALDADLLLHPDDAMRLVLFREPTREGEYSTLVKVEAREGGTSRTLATALVGPVTVSPPSGASPASALAPLDPRDGPAGEAVPRRIDFPADVLLEAAAVACGRIPSFCSDGGSVGYRIPSTIGLLDRVSESRFEAAHAALDAATTPPPAAARQAGWHDIAIDLAEPTLLRAGESLVVSITTKTDASTVSSTVKQLPPDAQRRFDFTALARPEIVNRHDTADHPARLELNVVTG